MLSHPNSGKRDADRWLDQQLFRYGQGHFLVLFQFAAKHLHSEFARVGLGICYDVRFPELAMISARQGKPILQPSYTGPVYGIQVAMC